MEDLVHFLHTVRQLRQNLYQFCGRICGHHLKCAGFRRKLQCHAGLLRICPPQLLKRGTNRLFCGIRLSDTQTGLRAVPASLFPELLQVRGDRFEYETNMLLQMERMGIAFVEQPIATVYDKEEYSSHYNAVKDSWRIFKIMAKARFGKR